MKQLALTFLLTAATALPASAQIRDVATESASLPPVVQVDERLAAGRSHPFLRTIAAVGGSAAGFAIAQSQGSYEPDDLGVPMAAGAAGGAVGTMLFSNASPFRIIMGSALAALPGVGLAMYIAGVTEDEEQEEYIPLIAFSIPQGLLASAFGQNR